MEKTTQRELKSMLQEGLALPTGYGTENQIPARELDVIKISHGIYGMNGALLRHRETGQLYAIPARETALFYYV